MSISKSQLDALNLGLLDNIGQANSPDLGEGTILEQAMMNIARQLSDDLKKSARTKGVVATRSLIQSIAPTPAITTVGRVEVTIVMDKEWRFANYGRKKGKRPPIKSIEDWITAKGIPVRTSRSQPGQSVLDMRRSMAFAIARKIGSRGTIKRFQYKGSKFVESVMTKENIRIIAQHLAELQGKKIELYFKYG